MSKPFLKAKPIVLGEVHIVDKALNELKELSEEHQDLRQQWLRPNIPTELSRDLKSAVDSCRFNLITKVEDLFRAIRIHNEIEVESRERAYYSVKVFLAKRRERREARRSAL